MWAGPEASAPTALPLAGRALWPWTSGSISLSLNLLIGKTWVVISVRPGGQQGSRVRRGKPFPGVGWAGARASVWQARLRLCPSDSGVPSVPLFLLCTSPLLPGPDVCLPHGRPRFCPRCPHSEASEVSAGQAAPVPEGQRLRRAAGQRPHLGWASGLSARAAAPSGFLAVSAPNAGAVAAACGYLATLRDQPQFPHLSCVPVGAGRGRPGASPGFFLRGRPRIWAQAPAHEATYGRGISRGGNLTGGPRPRRRPPSRSWKEKDPDACVRRVG